MMPLRLWANACAFVAVVACCFGPQAVGAQVREVTAFVSALGPDGIPLERLEPGDVEVREDGVVREILRIAPAMAPLDLTVILDNSAASASITADLRRAVPAFFAALRPDDQVTVVTVGERPSTAVATTTPRDAAQRALSHVFARPASGAYVLDALVETARAVEKRGAVRPVFVVVATDGAEFSSRLADEVIDRVEGAGASLHVTLVAMDPGAALATEEGRQRAAVYDRGVRQTGGRRVDLLTSQSLESTLVALARELTHQFEVVYARPATLIPPERTTIRQARPGLEVRGMRGPLPRR